MSCKSQALLDREAALICKSAFTSSSFLADLILSTASSLASGSLFTFDLLADLVLLFVTSRIDGRLTGLCLLGVLLILLLLCGLLRWGLSLRRSDRWSFRGILVTIGFDDLAAIHELVAYRLSDLAKLALTEQFEITVISQKTTKCRQDGKFRLSLRIAREADSRFCSDGFPVRLHLRVLQHHHHEGELA